MENFNKQIIGLWGDHCENVQQKLQTFEGGMHQHHFIQEFNYKQSQHKQCGVLKMSWLYKLKNYPSVIVFIQDLSDPDKFLELVENYNKIKSLSLSRKFQPKIVVLLVGKGVQSIDFSNVKKDIDFRKTIVIDMENLNGVMKRLKKLIMEDSLNFYEELFNKYKQDSHKLQKNELSDQKLIFEIKKHLISEVVNNQKRSLKHLTQAYDIVIQIAGQRRLALQNDDENVIQESYELILQIEEYREIADQLKFKIFRNLDTSEILSSFDIHYKTLKNLIKFKQFQIQEYLWRLRLFIRLIQFMDIRIHTMLYNVVFNYFQSILQNYIYIKQLPQEQQYECEYQIVQIEQEFLGRANYQIFKDNQQIEIRADMKCQLYKHIIMHRKQEINQLPDILFLFDLWKKFNETQETNSTIYIEYLKILITKDYSQRSIISKKMIEFGLVDELTHIIEEEFAATESIEQQINLLTELIHYDQSRIDDLFMLADKLTHPLNMVVSLNNCLKIHQITRIDNLAIRFEYCFNQKLKSCLNKGIIFSGDHSQDFNIMSEHVDCETSLSQPVQVKLLGQYKQLQIQLVCQDVELLSSGYKVDTLELVRTDPPFLTVHEKSAYVNEVNEIPISLTKMATVQLLNHSLDQKRLLKFKHTDSDTIQCKEAILLISDIIEYELVIEFKIDGKQHLHSILLKFPFDYKILLKQLDTVYKNAQNRNRDTISAYSKAAIQLQVKDVQVTKVSFKNESDVEILNKDKLNIIFKTNEATMYDKFGTYFVHYIRKDQEYSAKVPVTNVQVVNLMQDIQIIAPSECKSAQPFEVQVHITTKEPQNFYIQIKEESKKQFFIMGMVKQYQFIEQEHTLVYQMFPIEIGRCNIPGVIVEIRKPNNPHQLVFDSSGMKSIYVMP